MNDRPTYHLAVTNFGVCGFSRLAGTDWRLRRWRLRFLALSNASHISFLKAQDQAEKVLECD